MRLLMFPEFYALIAACLFMAFSILRATSESNKRERELNEIIKKYRPNVSRPVITRNVEHIIICENCQYANTYKITEKQ